MDDRSTSKGGLRAMVEAAVAKVALPRADDGTATTWVDTWTTEHGISGCARWLTSREPLRWAHVNIQGAPDAQTLARALVQGIETMSAKGGV